MIGKTLGHYRIEAKLGEGGMGAVYRARDLNLDRLVAIKVISAAVVEEDRRRRFRQEAKSASALDHPHILAVFEAGTADGQEYLVTELVDGTTLGEWAQAARPSVRQIVELMTGVADALACAHEAGILHRDVKPANILVSKKGYAKLADFGLAKLLEKSNAGDSEVETLSTPLTGADVVLGTLPYMSPEQACGQPADARSDIFSFGVVLYELLAGERPFTGKSRVDILHAIVHEAPRPLAQVSPAVPPDLRAIVEKALEKEPGERYQSMRELVIDVKRHRRGKSSEPTLMTTVERTPGRRWLAPTLAAAAALAVLALVVLWIDRSDLFWHNPLEGAQFTRLTDFEGAELDARISADGKFVVFLSDREGPFDAWLSQLGSGEFVNLTKGRVGEMNYDVANVGFSQDAGQVSYHVISRDSASKVTAITVWLVPTIGGAPRPFLEHTVQVAWSPDGSRIAYHGWRAGDPIFVADRNGTDPRQIYVGETGIHCHFLAWSLDGRFLYFVRGIPAKEIDIWRIPSAGGTAERITHHHSRVGYPTPLDDRTLIYSATPGDGSGSWLYAVDVERRVSRRVSFGVEQYISVSATTVAPGRPPRLVATVSNPSRNLWSVPLTDRVVEESAATRVTLPTVRAVAPRFGPDYVAYLSSRGGADGLWKAKGDIVSELWNAANGPVVAAPAVSSDGEWICFPVRKRDRTTLHLMSANGTNLRPLAELLDVRGAASWSPDGKWIAVAAEQAGGSRVFKVPVEGGAPIRLVDEVSSNPVWSPDGRFIAYAGPDVGATLPLKAVTPDHQPYPIPPLSLDRGGGFRFHPNGRSIVLLRHQALNRLQDFHLLDLETGHMRQLTNLRQGYLVTSFDVSRDGKQILFDRVRENSDIVLIDLAQRR